MTDLPENLRDDAAAFVLGAMSELEQEAFRVKAMRDWDLSLYVESLENVADELLLAAPPVHVPDELGRSILDEARRDLAAREIVTSPRGVPARRPEDRRRRMLRPLAFAMTLLVVAVGAFAAGGGLSDQPETPRITVSDFSAPDAPGMSGDIRVIGRYGAVVSVNGMDTRLGDDVYQLWVQHDGKIQPLPVFTVDAGGHGRVYVDHRIDPGDTVMITRERAGGETKPRGQPLASVTVS